MTSEKIAEKCDQIIKYLLLATLFIVPLFFNLNTYTTFEVDKIVLFRILTEVILFVYVVRGLFGTGVLWTKSKILIPIVFIIFGQVFATALSNHINISFWGSYSRNLGFFTWLHIYIFSYIFYIYLFKNLKLKEALYAMSGAGFIASVYGIAQVSGYDFLKWRGVDLMNRANSTFGQPNYFSSFLLFVLPIAAYLLYVSKNFKQRLIFSLLLFFESFALLFTYSRSAWLGFVVASVFLCFAWVYSRSKRWFWTSLVLTTFSFVLLLGSAVSGKIKPSPFLLSPSQRIATIFDLNFNSLRFFYYDAAWQLIKQSPIIGYGLDNQAYHFYKYYKPDYAIFDQPYLYTDRTHNELLDIVFTTGIVGLLGWFYLFSLLVAKIKRNDPQEFKALLFAVLFGLIGLSVYLMFSFFTIVSLLYFWLFIAILIYLTDKESQLIEKRLFIRRELAWALLVSFAAFNLLTIWSSNLRISVASYYYRELKKSSYQGRGDKVLPNIEKVVRFAPEQTKSTFYSHNLVEEGLYLFRDLDEMQKKSLLTYLLELLENQKAVDIAFETEYYRAKLLSLMGEWNRSEEIFDSLILNSPGYGNLHLAAGDNQYAKKDYQKALTEYEKALLLQPDLKHPYMNAEHYQLVAAEMVKAYNKIALTKEKLGDKEGARIAWEHVLRLEPFDQEAKTNIRRQNIKLN